MQTGDIFKSETTFRNACINELMGLVPQIEVGASLMLLNCLCANIYFDQKLTEQLGVTVKDIFVRMEKLYRDAFCNGREMKVFEDDLNVFLRMSLTGIDNLKPTEFKEIGPWDVQFNHIRFFRPRRAAGKPASGPLLVSFNENGFHYDKRDVDPEVIWSESLCGKKTDVIFNQYPFVRLHSLLVPQRKDHLPQHLTENLHRWTWDVFESLGHIKGIAGGYNSLKSFGSVNHFHIQMFIEPKGLPVTHGKWTHNGGTEAYPATLCTFDSAGEAWAWINKANDNDMPYNLLYVPGRLYCFGREDQGTYSQPSFTSGFAFCEMSGSFITFNKQDFDILTESDYAEALRSVPCPELLRE